MVPRIDHIEFTVSELDRAEGFYDAFLPLLGFDLRHKEREYIPEHDFACVTYGSAALSITIISPRAVYAREQVCRRKPGALHHLAFGVDSREEVDRLFGLVRALPGVTVVAPPRLYPEYTPDYYAFFCKDTEGVKLEVVHFDRPACF